jgi:DNA-binding NarL/FixJ family response regulator
MSPVIRVVVADDHPMVRYGIAAVLDAHPDVSLVGEASDGNELLAVVNEVRPDVVLTDLAMPRMGGIEAIGALRRHHPSLGVLVLTMHEDDESVFAALRAGARGYLIKGADGAELVRAIQTIAAGDAVYGAAIANRIISLLASGGPAAAADPFPELTGREREVLDLMAAGLRNLAIATRLGLSEKTVRNHVSAVLVKLQVPDRTAAALRAKEAGLGGS